MRNRLTWAGGVAILMLALGVSAGQAPFSGDRTTDLKASDILFESHESSIRGEGKYLENIIDSTDAPSTGSARPYWFVGTWGSWSSCSASTPSCSASTCGQTLTNWGSQSRTRTVQCRGYTLAGSTATYADATCVNAYLGTKPATSQSQSCSRSTTCTACETSDGGGGGGGTVTSGTTWIVHVYICGSGQAGYSNGPSTNTWKNAIIAEYRKFNYHSRCPESVGYVYWQNDLEKFAAQEGSYSAAWDIIRSSMHAAAQHNGEHLYSSINMLNKDCTDRAKQLYGSSVTASYVSGSGNKCVVN